MGCTKTKNGVGGLLNYSPCIPPKRCSSIVTAVFLFPKQKKKNYRKMLIFTLSEITNV